jgi:hypothetical protein
LRWLIWWFLQKRSKMKSQIILGPDVHNNRPGNIIFYCSGSFYMYVRLLLLIYCYIWRATSRK